MAMSITGADEVRVPDRPAVAGLVFRHFRQPDDYPGMAGANQRTRDAAGVEELASAEGMARNYAAFINWDPHDDTVVVERDSHKAMVIGEGGEKLKRIGTEARQELERLFDAKVFLQLFVKVRSGWADDEARVRSFGYE